MRKLSSIQLTEETRKELSKLGMHDDTYESIILRLIESYNEKSDTNTKRAKK